MAEYTLMSGTHTMGGRIYHVGDKLELTEDQAKTFDPGRIVRTGEESKESESKEQSSDDSTTTTSAKPTFIGAQKVSQGSESQTVNEIVAEQASKGEGRGDKIELGGNVEASSETDEESTTDTDDGNSTESILSGTVPEVGEEVSKINDVKTLNTLYEAENNGRQRAGVFKLILARKSELGE